MAIRTETYELSGRQFVSIWSDAGRYVVGGEPHGQYTEVNDPAEFGRTYTEGDLIPVDERTDISDKAEAYDILMGVSK